MLGFWAWLHICGDMTPPLRSSERCPFNTERAPGQLVIVIKHAVLHVCLPSRPGVLPRIWADLP